jgi:roadblock/LC7 domain-containing protein
MWHYLLSRASTRWGKQQKERKFMATLDELLNIEGVVAAGEFDADGTLVDYRERMGMSPEMAQMSAQFCATVTMMFNTLAGAFTQLSGMRWVPQQGWAYSGGEWTVAIGGGGYKGVFVETALADFNRLFEVLGGEQTVTTTTTEILPTEEDTAPPTHGLAAGAPRREETAETVEGRRDMAPAPTAPISGSGQREPNVPPLRPEEPPPGTGVGER